MRSWMIAFACGVVAVGFCRTLPALPQLIVASLAFLCLFTLARRRRLRVVALLAGLLCAGLAGAAWHAGNALWELDRRLPAALEGVEIEVTGRVASLPESRPAGQRFQFLIEESLHDLKGRRILLNTYGDEAVRAGERWRLVVRLNRPHGFANPGTFDYEAWLFGQRLSARGYVRDNPLNARLAAPGLSLLALRGYLRERIEASLASLETRAVLLALCLGDRSRIDDEQWALFTDTGTNHLVVVSGLHVALLAALCFLLTDRAWRLSSSLMLRWPAQKAGALGAIVGALCYSLIAGFGLPTQRALVMVCVFMLARLTGHHNRPLLSFLLALTLVLLLDPFATLGAGFWLSFSAVAVLLLSFTGRSIIEDDNRLRRLWNGWCKPQGVVFLGLLVPLGIWTGGVSPLSPVANLVAIPVVSWLVVPLSLLGLTTSLVSERIAAVLFTCADFVLVGLFRLMTWIVTFDGLPGMVSVAPLTPLALLAVGAGVLALLLPRHGTSRLLACLMIAPLFLAGEREGREDSLAIHVLDVGQGLSVLVQTRGHALLYDTGPRFASGFDSGSAIVAPVLNALDVARLDRLIVSHGDNDHAGGAASLLSAFAVGDIHAGEALPEMGRPVSACRADLSWNWDGVTFSYLHPASEIGGEGNNRSCVLSIRAEGFTALLPGDIEAPVERLLLTSGGIPAGLDLLVSAHHGSNTSSTRGFLAVANPALVIHSAGYRNQFRHPAWQVRQRLSDRGVMQLTTASLGMLSLRVKEGGGRPLVEAYRARHRRYWHWSENDRKGR